MTRSEAINHMKLEIKQDKSLVRRLLVTYGFKPEKPSPKFICPFHNDHNPSCSIMPNGDGHCFSCGETFDAIALMEHLKGFGYHEAVLHIWQNELGLPLPSYFPVGKNERKAQAKGPMFLSYDELKEIGLDGARFIQVDYQINICSFQEGKAIREGDDSVFHVKERDDNGDFALYKKRTYPSLYELYQEDRAGIAEMLKQKALDMVYYYRDWIDMINDPLTELGQICSEDKEYKKKLTKKGYDKIRNLKNILYKIRKMS